MPKAHTPPLSSAQTRSSVPWQASVCQRTRVSLRPTAARGQRRARDPDRRPCPGKHLWHRGRLGGSAPNAKRVPLPTYPFQRSRYWLKADSSQGDPRAQGQALSEHPLLGAAIALPEDEGWLLTGRLSLESHPWLEDHAVFDTVLLPGTAFLELALHAAQQAGL